MDWVLPLVVAGHGVVELVATQPVPVAARRCRRGGRVRASWSRGAATRWSSARSRGGAGHLAAVVLGGQLDDVAAPILIVAVGLLALARWAPDLRGLVGLAAVVRW